VADQEQSSPFPANKPVEHRAHPQLAAALRSRIGEILLVWEGAVRRTLPSTAELSFNEMADHLPLLLKLLAEAIGSEDPAAMQTLIKQAPEQGIVRIEQNRAVGDVMMEDRLLRRVIIEEVCDALGRAMTTPEQVALHTGIDIIAQEAVVAYVEIQEAQSRAAADVEAKYLSFLSHDLSNHLTGVTIWLKLLRQQLSASPASEDAVTTLDVVQRSIGETVRGIGRLLHSEKLRRQRTQARTDPVDVHALFADVLRQFAIQARDKGLDLAVDAAPGTQVHSDREILGLILNNLVGNAVKYSVRGTVRVGCRMPDEGGQIRSALYVSDEGPGIAPEHLTQIFESFRRGDTHGQPGLGLGLAIASHAAKLLGAELTVDSHLGKGSAFWITLPPVAS
jgi:signal transduction histidine kinase